MTQHHHDHQHHHAHRHPHPHEEHKLVDPGIHPMWFILIGMVLIGLIVLGWTMVVGF